MFAVGVSPVIHMRPMSQWATEVIGKRKRLDVHLEWRETEVALPEEIKGAPKAALEMVCFGF